MCIIFKRILSSPTSFHQIRNTVVAHTGRDFLLILVIIVEVPYGRRVSVFIINQFLFCGIEQQKEESHAAEEVQM